MVLTAFRTDSGERVGLIVWNGSGAADSCVREALQVLSTLAPGCGDSDDPLPPGTGCSCEANLLTDDAAPAWAREPMTTRAGARQDGASDTNSAVGYVSLAIEPHSAEELEHRCDGGDGVS
ncbi:MAG: hypothetical protein ACJATT_002705 [Myxococcota bacterium]